MAEQIPYTVATSLIDKIASSAFREIKRISGVKKDLDKLKDTLESIKVVLNSAELKQGQDPVIAHWLRSFKRVLYDADDLLDDVFIKDLRRQANGGPTKTSKVRGFFSISDNPIMFRVTLSRKIENIRKDFDDVVKEMNNLNLSLVTLTQDERPFTLSTCASSTSDIIGREENKSEVVNLLQQTHPNQNVSLIVVVGMPGLGKTTLAQLVWEAATGKNLFEKYMWVSVPKNFDVKNILKRMLESLGKHAAGETLQGIKDKLQEELNGRKYMLVLDGVWNEDPVKWGVLREHLRCGGQGSKLLVTARSTLVSQAMGIDEPYLLKGLTPDQSWTLLKKLTFGENSFRMNPEIKTIGQEIAKKCAGLPLTIKIIGGFLQSSPSNVDNWSSLLKVGIWSKCENHESFMPVLNWVYQRLPLELRQCFAYCCLYPKDSIIEKDKCIQLWMAQGYLAEKRGLSIEAVGNEYVETLLRRSFFQDASEDENGHIRSFKMPDLMHDLAMHVAGSDCYLDGEGKEIKRPIHVSFGTRADCSLDSFDACKLRTIIHRGEAIDLMAKLSVIEKLNLRVLCLFSSSITKLPISVNKARHLRYLDLSYSESLKSLPDSIGNLVCLQTLHLNGCSSLVSLPESIGNLVHLQTLHLRECFNLVSLPKSICNLVCLQTLILNSCSSLVFPTNIITKLINLRKLDIEDCKAFEDGGMPIGLGKLISLKSLPKFVVGNSQKNTSGKLNELKELCKLRGKLTISELGLVKGTALESLETNLISKNHIKDLSLLWGRGSHPIEYEMKNSDSLVLLDNLCPTYHLRSLSVSGFPGMRFSDWLTSLTNIVDICFDNFRSCKHLPPLERLPCLRKLQIHNMGSLECMHYYEDIDVFFPSLEQLHFSRCENLRGWERLGDDKNANETESHLSLPPFRCLASLQIYECPILTCMPSFPHLLEKPELVSIRGCPLLKRRFDAESGDDRPKIAHIPNISIV